LGRFGKSEGKSMDRVTAERLIAIYHRMGGALNEADPLLRTLPDAIERREHLQALGTMMQDVWLNLMLPIVRQHPDLDPDHKRR
jgi:hypothetical protein